jgi:hypothetical protein
MAKKKESNAKKVGRFVANEMLGIDDAKRAFNKAKKGDIKGAIKSAATAAFELGTSASAIGKAPVLAAKIASKSTTKAAEKTAIKIGQKVGQKTSERLPVAKYPSAKGKKFNIKTQGKSTTTSRSGGKSVAPDSTKVKGTKKNPTENQRLGSYKGQIKSRAKAVVTSADEARSSAKPVIQKALTNQRTKDVSRAFIAGKAVKGNENKKKK